MDPQKDPVVKAGCCDILNRMTIGDLKNLLSATRKEDKGEMIDAIMHSIPTTELLRHRRVSRKHLYDYLAREKQLPKFGAKKCQMEEDVEKLWKSQRTAAQTEMDNAAMQAGCKDILKHMELNELQQFLSAVRKEGKPEMIQAILNFEPTWELLDHEEVTRQHLSNYLASQLGDANKDTLVDFVKQLWKSRKTTTQMDLPHVEREASATGTVSSTTAQTSQTKRKGSASGACAGEPRVKKLDDLPSAMPISDVSRSPLKSKVSVKGIVLEDQGTKNVRKHDGEEPVVRKVIITDDDNSKIKVTLWREHAVTPFPPGQPVHMSNMIVNNYLREPSLDSSFYTTITR